MPALEGAPINRARHPWRAAVRSPPLMLQPPSGDLLVFLAYFFSLLLDGFSCFLELFAGFLNGFVDLFARLLGRSFLFASGYAEYQNDDEQERYPFR